MEASAEPEVKSKPKMRKAFIRHLVALLQEPVEDGIIHPAEAEVRAWLQADRSAACDWLYRAMIQPHNRHFLVAPIVRIIGRQPYELVGQWGLRVAERGLQYADVEIREAAVRALEAWGGAEALDILMRHVDSDPRLNDYVVQVILDLSEPEHVPAAEGKAAPPDAGEKVVVGVDLGVPGDELPVTVVPVSSLQPAAGEKVEGVDSASTFVGLKSGDEVVCKGEREPAALDLAGIKGRRKWVMARVAPGNSPMPNVPALTLIQDDVPVLFAEVERLGEVVTTCRAQVERAQRHAFAAQHKQGLGLERIKEQRATIAEQADAIERLGKIVATCHDQTDSAQRKAVDAELELEGACGAIKEQAATIERLGKELADSNLVISSQYRAIDEQAATIAKLEEGLRAETAACMGWYKMAASRATTIAKQADAIERLEAWKTNTLRGFRDAEELAKRCSAPPADGDGP